MPLLLSMFTGLFSVSAPLFLPCKYSHLYHFSRFHIYTLMYGMCFSLSDLLHSSGSLLFRAGSSVALWGPRWVGWGEVESRSQKEEIMGFLGGASGKEPTYQCRRLKRCALDLWVRKILWRRAWQPTLLFLPEKPHGQRSLVDYSP